MFTCFNSVIIIHHHSAHISEERHFFFYVEHPQTVYAHHDIIHAALEMLHVHVPSHELHQQIDCPSCHGNVDVQT